MDIFTTKTVEGIKGPFRIGANRHFNPCSNGYPRPTNVTLPNSSVITSKKALQFHLAICPTSRSQKVRPSVAKTRKNSNLVFFAKVCKITDYYLQITVGYLSGYNRQELGKRNLSPPARSLWRRRRRWMRSTRRGRRWS